MSRLEKTANPFPSDVAGHGWKRDGVWVRFKCKSVPHPGIRSQLPPFGLPAVFGGRQACHYYESSECVHVSIHSIAKVACYLLERTLMGCRGFHYAAPHQRSRVNEKRSGFFWGRGSRHWPRHSLSCCTRCSWYLQELPMRLHADRSRGRDCRRKLPLTMQTSWQRCFAAIAEQHPQGRNGTQLHAQSSGRPPPQRGARSMQIQSRWCLASYTD